MAKNSLPRRADRPEMRPRMTEWQVQPLSRRCAVTGEPLKPGDRVVCVVVKPVGAEITRFDVTEERLAEFKPEGIVLGRWARVVKDRQDEDKESRLRLLATREEFFLSLFSDEADPDGDKAVLKQLLALLLERKRIIRPLGAPSGNLQRYKHMRTGDEYAVPVGDISPEQVARVQNALEILVA